MTVQESIKETQSAKDIHLIVRGTSPSRPTDPLTVHVHNGHVTGSVSAPTGITAAPLWPRGTLFDEVVI